MDESTGTPAAGSIEGREKVEGHSLKKGCPPRHQISRSGRYFCLFSIGESPNQSHGHPRIVCGRTITHRYDVLDPMIGNESIDLLIELHQLLHGVKYFQLIGKRLNPYHPFHPLEENG